RGDRRAHLWATSANTQPAFATYLDDPDGSSASPAGLIVLTCSGERISALTRFHLYDLYPRFGRSEERRVGKEGRTRKLMIHSEDGIRDFHVTGVQTCALPISRRPARTSVGDERQHPARLRDLPR